MAYTRTTLITQARQILNEPTAQFWTDAELGDWVDQATLDISTKAHCVELQAPVTLVPNVQAYAVPTGAVGIEAVLLEGKSLAKLRARQFGFVSDSNDTRPTSYAHWAGHLHFYPIPADDFSVAVQYWGTTADVDLLPEGYEDLVLLYVLRNARLKEEKYPAAAQLHAMYLSELQFQRVDMQEREPDTKEKLRLADRIVSNGG